MLIINGKIYLEDRVIENGFIRTEGDRIVELGMMENAPKLEGDVIDAKGLNVLPGFIDQHIHGANGADHMDADQAGLLNIATFLPKEGTTSYLATTMTQSIEVVSTALGAIVEFMDETNKPRTSRNRRDSLRGTVYFEKTCWGTKPCLCFKTNDRVL
ncbi:amidohydrolase family protein [Erysipelothrix sp. D19-032]